MILRNAVEHVGARAAIGAFAVLPARAARGLGSAAAVGARAFGVRRDTVRSQIEAAFPDREEAWVEDVVKGCYRHYGREAAVIARLQSGRDRHLLRDTTTRADAEPWIDRMKRGEGTIVVTGHLGNWEVAGAYMAERGVPLAAVVKRQRNPAFNEWLVGTRHRLGIEPIYMQDARRVIPELLAAGRSVALVADQDARSRGLMVTFMGRPASTFRGPARLAIETGAPLVFGSAVRSGDAYLAAIDPVREACAPSGPDPAEELALTGEWVRRLEGEVRTYPEQYFWFHRRWKSGNALTADAVPQADPSPEDPVEGVRAHTTTKGSTK